MSPSIHIAVRFLIAKKRSMIMSLGGIAFGVGFFIITQAQTSGFEEFFIRTILGTDGAIRIEDRYQNINPRIKVATEGEDAEDAYIVDRESRKYVEGVEHPDKIVEAIETLSNVQSTSSVLKGSVQIESALRGDSAQIYGVELEDHIAVSDLEKQILFGSLDDFRETPTGLLVGKKLADRLQVRVGDSVVLEELDQRNRYRVSAIYETGVSEIDELRVFMRLSAARSLLKKPHGVSFIQVSVYDRDQAPFDALAIERMTMHVANAWQDREKSWLEVFKALQISAAITVSTIILISGLGMFNTLVMIVMEKTREIAILRSSGYTREDIAKIFLWQGFIVLVLGALLGYLIGGFGTLGITHIKVYIRGIFTTDGFPVNWDILHYVYATLAASIIVMVSSVFPARRAARLVPGDVIRGTAS